MENSTKALLISGIIMVCVLIIAVGMFVFNNASGTVTDSITAMSTQEIDTFNKQFNLYEGLQSGTQVKALMGVLLSNVKANHEDPLRIPGVGINKCANADKKQMHAPVPESGDTSEYVEVIGQIRNKLEKNHNYWVELTYQKNGLVDYITITYDAENPEATYTRDHMELSSL